MSTGKVVSIQVGSAAAAGALTGALAIAGLAAAASAAVRVLDEAIQKAIDAKRKAEIEQRKREISDIQAEIEVGRQAADGVAAQFKELRLGAQRQSLETRLAAIKQRRTAMDGKEISSDTRRSRSDHKKAVGELEREIESLRSEVLEQEAAMRAAVAQALEIHTANRDSSAAIARIASLSLPPLERPADLVGYFEEASSLWRSRRDAASRTSLADSLRRALDALPEQVSAKTLSAIAVEIRALATAPSEASAQAIHGRAIDLVKKANEEAKANMAIRSRIESVRRAAQDLAYEVLPPGDLERLALDDTPSPDVVAGMEARLHAAQERERAKIAHQKMRFARAATLDVLQQLGYETSVVDEMSWFKNGSMFISRPEWGDFVVRITPDGDSFRAFAGRYVGDEMDRDAARRLTPEMERRYKALIDAWCGKHLGVLAENLASRGVAASATDIGLPADSIQPVVASEVGEKIARRIEEGARTRREGGMSDTSRGQG